MTEETHLIHIGSSQQPLVRTVGPAVQKGSTVLLPDAAALYDDDNYITYGRQGLSAQTALIEGLNALEGACATTLYPSGLAALSGAMLAVLAAGDDVLAPDTIYKPTRRFCDRVLARYGVTTRYYDPRLSPEALLALATPQTRLIVLESPGSLTFEMQDIPAIAALAKARGILTLADNTWGAGYLFKPLAHGVDISVQALTKYVGGHSDVFMGSASAADREVAARLNEGVLDLGWAVSGEEAYQMLRGLRTLAVRLDRHGENGLKVAAWLADRPQVAGVIHPALPGDAGHAIWARDYSGACGLFSFVLAAPAPARAVDAFLDALKIFGLGFSWGGFESLAISVDPQLKSRSIKRDYGGPMVRLHVGLEDPNDLIADLQRGLAAFDAAR